MDLGQGIGHDIGGETLLFDLDVQVFSRTGGRVLRLFDDMKVSGTWYESRALSEIGWEGRVHGGLAGGRVRRAGRIWV